MRAEPELGVGFDSPAPRIAGDPGGRRLEIGVIVTNRDATLAALKTAAQLAVDLDAQIRLLAIQVVPYPAPLDSPPVRIAFTARCMRSLAEAVTSRISIEVYLCRDARQTLRDCLNPQSLLVIGGRRRWWPTREQRLARWLEKLGQQVVLAIPAGKEENIISLSRTRSFECRTQSTEAGDPLFGA
jgi:hypothetical protein